MKTQFSNLIIPNRYLSSVKFFCLFQKQRGGTRSGYPLDRAIVSSIYCSIFISKGVVGKPAEL